MCSLALLLSASASHAKGPCVLLVGLQGAVTVGSAQYLERAVRRAEQQRCTLLIEVSSPGGTLDATRDIVQALLGAKVSSVSYVTPSGARAGSAAMFITLAANVAAMAPGTNIGAAHPVTASGGDPEADGGQHLARKVVNDTAALARAIAQTRGRNANWAGEAVTESASLTANEALENRVVDLVASSRRALLKQLDGRPVRVGGRSLQLRTEAAPLHHFEPTLQERVLGFLGHPNVAYALLSLGMLGILLELLNPGTFIAGGIGAVAVLLGAIGMKLLPINLGALLLLVLAALLFVAEVYVTSYGALALGGVTLMLLGASLLIDKSDPSYFVDRDFGFSWAAVVPLAAVLAASAVGVGWLAKRSGRAPPVTGKEHLLEQSGFALTRIDSQGGAVRIDGGRWSARSPQPIETGSKVRVSDINGLVLSVVQTDSDRATHQAKET